MSLARAHASEPRLFNGATPLQWSQRLADSEMKRLGTSLETGGSNAKARWDYSPGVLALGLVRLGETTGNAAYAKAVQTLRDQMRTHPRTSEGGFWHKKRYPHQMWLEGLYMASPFIAQCAVEFNKPALFDEVAKQIALMDAHSYDTTTGLFWRAWDEAKAQS